jgi:hypothetical protein
MYEVGGGSAERLDGVWVSLPPPIGAGSRFIMVFLFIYFLIVFYMFNGQLSEAGAPRHFLKPPGGCDFQAVFGDQKPKVKAR